MRTFVTDGRTDGRTDGADYIGPEAGPKICSGHPIIFLKKYGKYGNFFPKNMGGIWAILEFSWQNLAKIWEIWAIFNHFFHIFSIFSTIKM